MNIHNVLALSAARTMIHLVHRGGEWRQVFAGEHVSLGYVRSAVTWPIPDAVLVDGEDAETSIYCAIEFKPPNSSKSECVRGLGQSSTYLADYDCAALILPDQSVDGFSIADYLARLISTPAIAQERIGVYAYPIRSATSTLTGPFPLNLLKPIGGMAEHIAPGRRPHLERAFWGFWRDFSLHEIFLVLDAADRRAGDADIKESSLTKGYAEYAALRTRDPQGRPRTRPAISERHFKGNLSTTLTHLDLWHNDGLLTEAGRALVHAGRLFGPESAPHRDCFARQSLLAGRHYELLKLVFEFQRNNSGRLASAEEFVCGLESFLEEEGLLKRLPGRRTTGSRRFFKAELTFWGVLLDIIRKRGRSYVVPGVGLDFDWPRILDLLQQ